MSEDMRAEVCWALAFHSYSPGVRAKRWYRVVRLAFVDGAWFELYWHSPTISGNNEKELRKIAAEGWKLTVRKGLFTTPRNPGRFGGNEMVQI